MKLFQQRRRMIILRRSVDNASFCIDSRLKPVELVCTTAARERFFNWVGKNQGAGIETPKASRGGEWGGSFPLPSRLGGLGERRKLPQRGPAENGFGAFSA